MDEKGMDEVEHDHSPREDRKGTENTPNRKDKEISLHAAAICSPKSNLSQVWIFDGCIKMGGHQFE